MSDQDIPGTEPRPWQSVWREQSLDMLGLFHTPDPPDLEESVDWILQLGREAERTCPGKSRGRRNGRFWPDDLPDPHEGIFTLLVNCSWDRVRREMPKEGLYGSPELLLTETFFPIKIQLEQIDAAEVLLFGLDAHMRRKAQRTEAARRARETASEEDLAAYATAEDGTLVLYRGGRGGSNGWHLTVPPFVTALTDCSFGSSHELHARNMHAQIDLPDSVWYIGTRALSGAHVESVRMPGVEVIASQALERTNLWRIELPESLVSMAPDALAGTRIREAVLNCRPEVFAGCWDSCSRSWGAMRRTSGFSLICRGCMYEDIPKSMQRPLLRSFCRRFIEAAGDASLPESRLMSCPSSVLPEEERTVFRGLAEHCRKDLWSAGGGNGWVLRQYMLSEELVTENSFVPFFDMLQKEQEQAEVSGDSRCLEHLHMLTAEMMDYRSRVLSAEKLQAAADRRERAAMRTAFREGPAPNELRRIWKTEKNGDIPASRKAYSLTIVSYRGAGDAVDVPACIGTGTVTRIGPYAFALGDRASRPRRITLPEGLLELEEYALTECRQAYFELPESLRKIGYDAFARCRNLRYLVIPAGVEEASAACIYACSKLQMIAVLGRETRITVPRSRRRLHGPFITVAGWPGSGAERLAEKLDVPLLPLGTEEFAQSEARAGMVKWLIAKGFSVPHVLEGPDISG